MRKYIYKKKEKFDGTYEIQRWIAKGTYYIFDKIIFDTDKDFNDYKDANLEIKILSFTENDKLQYNQNQRLLRAERYKEETDSLLFKAFELSDNDKDNAIKNYIDAKNNIRNELKYL